MLAAPPIVIRLPAVKGVTGNAEPVADLSCRHSRLMLLERGGDLICREPLLLHTIEDSHIVIGPIYGGKVTDVTLAL